MRDMNPVNEHMDKEIATTALPDLPPQGYPLVRLSVGQLPTATARALMRRLVERSGFGARKFGQQWRGRRNTVEMCEETTDAIVYACQETANIDLGLTPLIPGSYRALTAKDLLFTAARHTALADHRAQEAHQLIWENGPLDDSQIDRQ